MRLHKSSVVVDCDYKVGYRRNWRIRTYYMERNYLCIIIDQKTFLVREFLRYVAQHFLDIVTLLPSCALTLPVVINFTVKV